MMPGMLHGTGLPDHVRLGVLTKWVTADLVDEILAECGKQDQLAWPCPADSDDDVAENLWERCSGQVFAHAGPGSGLGTGVIEAVSRRLE